MGLYALIDTHNRVVNAVVWDGVAAWSPPEGLTLVNIEDKQAGIGFTYDPGDGSFAAPPVVEDVISAGPPPNNDAPNVVD